MKLYNEDIKNKFLEIVNEKEVPQILSIFRRGAEAEKFLKKDLYDFNSNEILDYLTLLNRSTTSSLLSCWSHITKYIDWAIYQKITKGTTNLSRDLTIEDVKNCIDEGKKLYITANEFEGIIDTLVNHRDRAMFMLLFDGVQGHRCSEIRNLKKVDVLKAKENGNILTVLDDKYGLREIKVSDECINECLLAADENKYHNKNGASESPKGSMFTLADNEYVIRNKKTSTQKDLERSSFNVVVYTMRTVLAPEVNDYPFLNPTRINRSGVLYEGYKIYKEKGKLEKKDYEQIINKRSERYDDLSKKIYSIKQYVNEEEIKKYYAKELGIKDGIKMR
ncbi:site-specific integrase [Bacillus sonorensis]|uniref:phage lytic cycle repressor MrpR family protein n=1 Tax=Bacillus sonorensis TaxID=119858 RepID=UPI001F282596|nr:site-specific integrase [Bacillus sonorensis]MCF7618608.1 site-specific integrase [Bacillus sonorensis]